MIYIDTSALAAIFFRESNGTLVFGQIIAASPRKLMVSSWALTEMAAARAWLDNARAFLQGNLGELRLPFRTPLVEDLALLWPAVA